MGSGAVAKEDLALSDAMGVGRGDSSVPAGEPLGEWKTLIQHLGIMRLLVSCPRVLGGSVYCTVGSWQWDNFRIQAGWEAGRGS